MHCKHNHHTAGGLRWLGCIAAALALSSCTATGEDDAPATGGVPVGFSAMAEWKEAADGNGAKAATRLADGTDGLAFGQGDAIGVFAYHNDSSTPDFMNNQKVGYDGTAWTYSPTKYWLTDKDERLSFYAYYPYNAAGINIATADGHPTMTYDNTRADIDWMAAKRETVAYDDGKDGVPLNFKHLTARVKFRFAIDGSMSYHPVVHVLKYKVPHYRGTMDFAYDESSAFACNLACDGNAMQITRYVDNVEGEIVYADGIVVPEFTAYLFPCSFPCTDDAGELGEFVKSINNIEHTCKPDKFINIEAGKSYTVNFNVKQPDDGSTNYFITSYSLWEDGGNYEENLN